MNSRKLLATVCGGALILAACVNSPTSADLTSKASTAIGASGTPVTPALTVGTSAEGDGTTSTTTLVGSSSTVVETQALDQASSTTTLVVSSPTLVASSEDDEAGSTTVSPVEALAVDGAGPADDDPEVLDSAFVPLDLPIGTCFDDPPHDVELVTHDDISIVDCDAPHANEVFDNSEVEGEEFPGDASVHLQADNVCYESFESYVGVTYESSVYDFSWYFPTEQSWTSDGRNIICFAYYRDLASITGSIEGTGR